MLLIGVLMASLVMAAAACVRVALAVQGRSWLAIVDRASHGVLAVLLVAFFARLAFRLAVGS